MDLFESGLDDQGRMQITGPIREHPLSMESRNYKKRGKKKKKDGDCIHNHDTQLTVYANV